MAEYNNADILNAIGGVSAQPKPTTLSTGIDGDNSGLSNSPDPLQSNMNYMNTANNLMGSTAFNPYMMQMYNPMIRHGIGKDNWSSNMGLDQQAILQNIGLGGQ